MNINKFGLRVKSYCEPTIARVLTDAEISPASRSTSMAMFLNLTVNPMISGLVISITNCPLNDVYIVVQ